MFPLASKARFPLIKVVGIVLCAFFVIHQACAVQVQAQMELSEAGRKIKTRVPPQYPELARKTKIQGMARVEFTVSPDGTVKDVRELGGNPVLLEALIKAVKQWKYEPASHDTLVEVKAAFVAPS